MKLVTAKPLLLSVKKSSHKLQTAFETQNLSPERWTELMTKLEKCVGFYIMQTNIALLLQLCIACLQIESQCSSRYLAL